MSALRSGLNNNDLKKRNAKVFSLLNEKLKTDDEKEYIEAASKISKFIGRKEAYYPEARQPIADIFKTARSTLTRLSERDIPFRRDALYPQSLESRVQAYVELITTGIKFRGEFATTDIDTSELLKDIWSSIDEASKAKPEQERKTPVTGKQKSSLKAGKKNAEPSATKSVNNKQYSHKSPDLVETQASSSGSLVDQEQISKDAIHETPPEATSEKLSEVVDESGRVEKMEVDAVLGIGATPVERDGSEVTLVGSEQVQDSVSTTQEAPLISTVAALAATYPSTSAEAPALKSPMNPPTPPSVASPLTSIRNSLAKRKSMSPSPLSVSVSRSVTPQPRVNSPFGAGPSVPPPPSAASTSSVTLEQIPNPTPATTSATATPSKPAGRPKKKPKLGGNSSLLALVKDGDVEWWKKKKTLSSPTTPRNPDNGSAPPDENRQITPAELTDPIKPLTVNENSSDVITAQLLSATAEPVDAESEKADAMDIDKAPSASEDADIITSGREAPTEDKELMAAAETQQQEPKPDDSVHTETPAEDHSEIVVETSTIPETTSQVNGHQPKNPNISLALGGKVNSFVSIKLELDSCRVEQLKEWCTRHEHERDVSASLCISIACYKMDDLIDAGIVPDENSVELDLSVLTSLKGSWPTNSRLGAEIGTWKMFLSPPLTPTAENLVDISNRVDDEGKIELRIDHRCDMTDYAFALIAHPPTASQLAYCEERRTKERRWRNFLRELTTPLTMEELFPQKTVTV